jgi:hypothetical protein
MNLTKLAVPVFNHQLQQQQQQQQQQHRHRAHFHQELIRRIKLALIAPKFAQKYPLQFVAVMA